MRELPADIIFISEHRMIKAEATHMEQQLQAIGWRASTAQGKKTELGVSGGTLVGWKHGMQCRGRDMDPPPQHAGRLAAAEISIKGELKVLLVAIYGYSGDG